MKKKDELVRWHGTLRKSQKAMIQKYARKHKIAGSEALRQILDLLAEKFNK